MTRVPSPTRRELLMTSLLLPLAAFADARAAPADGRALVAWFSRSGNTRVIAGQIARSLQADRFEIQPASPYPDDYFETVEQATQERDAGFEPPLAASVDGMDGYETLYLGFPIWGMTAPPVIWSFLSGHDLTGKTIVPFITHGGYGLGDSLAVVARHAPRARSGRRLRIGEAAGASDDRAGQAVVAATEHRTITPVTICQHFFSDFYPHPFTLPHNPLTALALAGALVRTGCQGRAAAPDRSR